VSTRKAIVDLLNASQKAAWNELIGAPFRGRLFVSPRLAFGPGLLDGNGPLPPPGELREPGKGKGPPPRGMGGPGFRPPFGPGRGPDKGPPPRFEPPDDQADDF
jgi:hypothetical protein